MESDLPDDLRDQVLLAFKAAMDMKMSVGNAIVKVQKDVLSKCNEIFKGQRYKGYIKFDYTDDYKFDYTNIIEIKINKFANGNLQFSSGVSVKKMVPDRPDPYIVKMTFV